MNSITSPYYDTGQGIEENHLNRFSNVSIVYARDVADKMAVPGLGLSIVKNAVLFHKGDISAKIEKTGIGIPILTEKNSFLNS